MIRITPSVRKEVIVNKIGDNHDEEPYGVFIKNEPLNEYSYKVRIIACIPVKVGTTFEVEVSTDKEDIKTPYGDFYMRTIHIRWRKDIKPQDGPHTVWSITVQYTPENDEEEDKGILIQYKFGTSGPIKPRLSRGTVTTSANPHAY